LRRKRGTTTKNIKQGKKEREGRQSELSMSGRREVKLKTKPVLSEMTLSRWGTRSTGTGASVVGSTIVLSLGKGWASPVDSDGRSSGGDEITLKSEGVSKRGRVFQREIETNGEEEGKTGG